MSTTTKTLLACTAAAAFVGSANAAMLSNIGNTWPDSPALETVTNTEDNNGRGVTEARGEFVQSFTTTAAFQIDKIYIEVNGITANVDFQMRIFETSDVTAATTNVGTVVLAPITLNTGSTANGNVQDVLEIDLVGAEQISCLQIKATGLDCPSWTMETRVQTCSLLRGDGTITVVQSLKFTPTAGRLVMELVPNLISPSPSPPYQSPARQCLCPTSPTIRPTGVHP
jgi:hypothetical protein